MQLPSALREQALTGRLPGHFCMAERLLENSVFTFECIDIFPEKC